MYIAVFRRTTMRKFIYSISVFLTCVCFTHNAHAIWPDFTPLIPFSPQFCPMCVAPAISTAVSYYDQVKEIRKDLEKYTDMTTLKQMALTYAAKMGTTTFNKWKQSKEKRKKIISYARTIKDSTIADLKDEASVKDAFIKLFMQYPSDKAQVKEAYKTLGEQLKMDTTMEMYLTAIEMEKELYGKPEAKEGSKNMEDLGMLRQLDMIESCLVGGEKCDEIGLTSCQEQADNGDDTKEDQVCFWNSALQAEKLYETIMKYNLMLVAMHAQHQAVIGIDKLAKIREYDKEKDKDKTSDKTSSLPEKYLAPSENTAYNYISAEVSFADLSTEEEQLAAEELAEYEENLTNRDNVIKGDFEDANNPQSFTAAIDEREDDVASLKILQEIRQDLNSAQHMHNMKQTLPEYKKVFEDYASAQKQMELAQQNLAESGECIMNMLKPHYTDSNITWFGQNCIYSGNGQITCHYEPERPIDSEATSDGLFDTVCAGDSAHSCYVAELHADSMPNGIAKYLFTLYTEAKDEDAAGDTEASVQVLEEQNGEDGYITRATISLDTDEENKKEDDALFITSHSSDDSADEELLDEITTQTSDKGTDDTASNLKDQQKGEEEKENARKDSLIRWVIGSEVAKELALDLDTGVNEWGTRKSKFPLWTDQIYFYDQYIDGKYENIAEYISQMSQMEILLKIALNLNPVYPYKTISGVPPISPDKQRKDAEKMLKELQKSVPELKQDLADSLKEQRGVIVSQSAVKETPFENFETLQIEAAIKAEEDEYQKIREEYAKNRATKQKELQNWYKIINDANTQISELNQEYNKNHEMVKSADATTPEATEGVEYSQEIYAGRKLSKDSPQNAEFNKTRQNNEKMSAQAKSVMASAENKIKNYENIVKRAQEKAAQIKEDLEKLRVQYVKNMSDAEAKSGVMFNELVENLRVARKIKALDSAIEEVLPLDLTNRLVQCVRDYALKQVSEAKAKIDKLKTTQELYYVETAPKVQQIHNDMIKKITAIKLTDLKNCEAIDEMHEFAADTQENLTPALNIFTDVCKEQNCTQEDSEYFVGAIGLPQDFSAPKSPVNFSSAPVREIFHFDVADFNNMDKYYTDRNDVDNNRKVYISVESFLKFLNQYGGMEYGGKTYASTVPEIWKYIMKHHAFVQKQIDWAKLLGEKEEMADLLVGDNEKTLLRSGVYPCLSENNVIDVVNTNDGPMYYHSARPASFDEQNKLPQCRGIKLTNQDGNNIVADEEVGGGYRPVTDNLSTTAIKGSELGTILAYIPDLPSGLSTLFGTGIIVGNKGIASLPHRLTFNNSLLKAIDAINKTEDVGSDMTTDMRFYQANRVLYDRNQFGDYLDQVEYESIVADQMKKLEKQIAEIRQKLADTISVGTFEITDDFNLLNEQDYNQAAQTIDEEKGIYIDMALQKMQSLPKGAGMSANVRDKYEKLMHKVAVLQADSDEIVAVNGTEELEDLEAKIKNRQADIDVGNKYNEAKKAEDERQKTHYRHPYCAAY